MTFSLRPLALVLALFGAAGCGTPSGADQAQAAQDALAAGKYADALAAAEAGLATEESKADKALAFRLERARVDACAGLGDAQAVLTHITTLGRNYPAQVSAELYARLGNSLMDAQQPIGALEVVDAGRKKYPEAEAAFDELIATLKDRAAAGDNELLDRLKSMGYT